MKNINFIESISERDIDMLLLEEFSVSENFQNWFIDKIGNFKINNFIWVWHSISHNIFWESDLVIIFENTDNTKIWILIENKIN